MELRIRKNFSSKSRFKLLEKMVILKLCQWTDPYRRLRQRQVSVCIKRVNKSSLNN